MKLAVFKYGQLHGHLSSAVCRRDVAEIPYYTHGLPRDPQGLSAQLEIRYRLASFEDARSRVLGATLLVHCKFLIWPAPTIMVSLVPNITHITTVKHLQCCCVWGAFGLFSNFVPSVDTPATIHALYNSNVTV